MRSSGGNGRKVRERWWEAVLYPLTLLHSDEKSRKYNKATESRKEKGQKRRKYKLVMH